MEAEARESSGDVFARTMNDVRTNISLLSVTKLLAFEIGSILLQVYAMLSSLVNSSVAEERLGGVLGIDALIEVNPTGPAREK